MPFDVSGALSSIGLLAQGDLGQIRQLPYWFVLIHDKVGINVYDAFNQLVMLVVWGILLFTLLSVVGQAAVVFMVLMERKVLAWVTQRKGPNRVGPWGVFQTLADGVKLLFKEDIMRDDQDKLLFTLGPVVFILPVFVIYALIPFTGPIVTEEGLKVFEGLIGTTLPVGALLIFALSSISMIGIVLAGWSSNNKYSLIGGMRSAAQAISYEIPLVLAVLAVVLFTGSMNPVDIVAAQQGPLGMFSWFWIYLTPIAFLIFVIASIAEVNRIPFDLPEAESELVSGYNTEYSGMKFAMFFLAEYASLFAMSALTAVFFLGGHASPLTGLSLDDLTFKATFTETFGWSSTLYTLTQIRGIGFLLIQFEMITWFLLKTYLFIFFAMWVRGTLPRLKPDQLMGFSWKFLIPLSLINIFLVGFWRMWLPPVDTWEALVTNASRNLPFGIVWAIVLLGGVGGFCWYMSHYFTTKLKARFARS